MGNGIKFIVFLLVLVIYLIYTYVFKLPPLSMLTILASFLPICFIFCCILMIRDRKIQVKWFIFLWVLVAILGFITYYINYQSIIAKEETKKNDEQVTLIISKKDYEKILNSQYNNENTIFLEIMLPLLESNNNITIMSDSNFTIAPYESQRPTGKNKQKYDTHMQSSSSVALTATFLAYYETIRMFFNEHDYQFIIEDKRPHWFIWLVHFAAIFTAQLILLSLFFRQQFIDKMIMWFGIHKKIYIIKGCDENAFCIGRDIAHNEKRVIFNWVALNQFISNIILQKIKGKVIWKEIRTYIIDVLLSLWSRSLIVFWLEEDDDEQEIYKKAMRFGAIAKVLDDSKDFHVFLEDIGLIYNRFRWFYLIEAFFFWLRKKEYTIILMPNDVSVSDDTIKILGLDNKELHRKIESFNINVITPTEWDRIKIAKYIDLNEKTLDKEYIESALDIFINKEWDQINSKVFHNDLLNSENSLYIFKMLNLVKWDIEDVITILKIINCVNWDLKLMKEINKVQRIYPISLNQCEYYIFDRVLAILHHRDFKSKYKPLDLLNVDIFNDLKENLYKDSTWKLEKYKEIIDLFQKIFLYRNWDINSFICYINILKNFYPDEIKNIKDKNDIENNKLISKIKWDTHKRKQIIKILKWSKPYKDNIMKVFESLKYSQWNRDDIDYIYGKFSSSSEYVDIVKERKIIKIKDYLQNNYKWTKSGIEKESLQNNKELDQASINLLYDFLNKFKGDKDKMQSFVKILEDYNTNDRVDVCVADYLFKKLNESKWNKSKFSSFINIIYNDEWCKDKKIKSVIRMLNRAWWSQGTIENIKKILENNNWEKGKIQAHLDVLKHLDKKIEIIYLVRAISIFMKWNQAKMFKYIQYFNDEDQRSNIIDDIFKLKIVHTHNVERDDVIKSLNIIDKLLKDNIWNKENIESIIKLQREEIPLGRFYWFDNIYPIIQDEGNYSKKYNVYMRTVEDLITRQMIESLPPYNCLKFNQGKTDSDFTVLILGFGKMGQAALLRLIRNGQFIGSKMKAIIVDENIDDKKEAFHIKYPAIENHCCKLIFCKIHLPSHKLFKCIECFVIDYIVIATNNDTVNKDTATAINLFFNRLQIEKMPQIAIISDPENRECLRENTNFKSENILIFGGREDIYKEKIILRPETDKIARIINKIYNEKQRTFEEQVPWNCQPWHKKEIRRSVADFFDAILHLTGFLSKEDKDSIKNNPENKKYEKHGILCKIEARDRENMIRTLAKTEHLRWYADYATMGWVSKEYLRILDNKDWNVIKGKQEKVILYERKIEPLLMEWDCLESSGGDDGIFKQEQEKNLIEKMVDMDVFKRIKDHTNT